MRIRIDWQMTEKQKSFVDADTTEVLYGGAAGGGKSYVQVMDAMIFALKYEGSKQLILRRTFAELEKSIIRTVHELYPREIFKFNSSTHTGRFANGSIIDFGYIANEKDVYQYQSAEYDVIRFDELTHFTETQYVYMLSRVRGANGYPKQMKSSTNPGGVGHQWVKKRFVDPSPPNKLFIGEGNLSKVFIPALLTDNPFLAKNDPSYRERLEALSEREKKALLYGDWNIFEGQYFDEFDEKVHVCEPFEIPKDWRRYRALDYGLDMLACVFVAVNSLGQAFVYKEVGQSNLPISSAAGRVLDMTERDKDGHPTEEFYLTLAPPDLWNRSQETGRSKATIFGDAGLYLTKSNNDREAGWLAIKELLKLDSNGEPRLKIFNTCRELIKCLPALIRDEKKPTDCATEPHEITHHPDALRYFAVFWWRPGEQVDNSVRKRWTPDMWEDYNNATDSEREYLIQKYGKPL
ncbi:MAG: phage terminase large subunit [Acutalibacteraceae bacterium]|nr:phage terminase large subunit [Acutalibacteraceae bacterium]